jgi:hypothetical protein
MEVVTKLRGVQPTNFQAVFCRWQGCSEEQFRNRFFWKTVHRRALPFVGILRWIWPDFFKMDWQLIDEIGDAQNTVDMFNALLSYRHDCHREQRFLHDRLRLRISGRRVTHVINQMHGQDRPPRR